VGLLNAFSSRGSSSREATHRNLRGAFRTGPSLRRRFTLLRADGLPSAHRKTHAYRRETDLPGIEPESNPNRTRIEPESKERGLRSTDFIPHRGIPDRRRLLCCLAKAPDLVLWSLQIMRTASAILERFCAFALAAVSVGSSAGCNVALDFEQCQSNEECAGYDEERVCSDHICISSAPGPGDSCDVGWMCNGVINFGSVSVQTGPAAEVGILISTGIRVAFFEANEQGGVMGNDVALTLRDDGYDPERTTAEVKALTDGGSARPVLALVGNVGTPTAAVTLPIIAENDVVFHAAYTGSDLLREDPPARLVFNFRPSYQQEVVALIEYLLQDRDVAEQVPTRNIAFFGQGTIAAAGDSSVFDGFGGAGFAGVAAALPDVPENEIPVASYQVGTSNVDVAREYVINWLATANLTPSGDGIVRAGLMQVALAPVSARLIIDIKNDLATVRGGGDPTGMTLTDDQRMQLANIELFFGISPGADPVALSLAAEGPEYCGNVIISQVVPLPDGSSQGAFDYQQVLERYNLAFGEANVPGFVSFEGYLAAKMIVDALRNAPTIDTEGLLAGLQSTNLEYGIGTTLSMSVNDHQASDKVFGTQLDETCAFESLAFGGG